MIASIGITKANCGPALLDAPVVMQTLKLSSNGTGEYLDWTAWELLGAAELVSEIDAAYAASGQSRLLTKGLVYLDVNEPQRNN